MNTWFSSRVVPFEKLWYRLALVAALLGVALIFGATPAPAAHAATNVNPTWCQNWDPNPANTTSKQIAPGTNKVSYAGSTFEIDQGYYNGVLYDWANEANGTAGDEIALGWFWNGDSNWYQCGDSHGYNAATVWTSGGDTWTAGVPASQIVGFEVLFWPNGQGNSSPAILQVYTNVHSVWCQNWDPNPANASNKQIVPGTNKISSGGSVFEVDQGYYNGVLYYWANEANGSVGDQIAVEWQWGGLSGNGNWYQCGDSHGYNAATVWTNGGDTWTAGIPANQVGGFDILFWFNSQVNGGTETINVIQ